MTPGNGDDEVVDLQVHQVAPRLRDWFATEHCVDLLDAFSAQGSSIFQMDLTGFNWIQLDLTGFNLIANQSPTVNIAHQNSHYHR